MSKALYYELPEFSAILSFIDAIFIDLNMGLFIYHMEEEGQVESLRLIYANKEASRSTGADVQALVGQRIHDAFPSLSATEIPATFVAVIPSGESRRLEDVEYEDEQLEKHTYSVKAFPMPSTCVGVLFERTA